VKIFILCIGKTHSSYLKEGIGIYLDRLKHYTKVEYLELPDVPNKGLLPEALKQKEGELIMKHLKADDLLFLLDEKGDEFSSREFAALLQKRMNSGLKQMVLVTGGAFGFSKEVYQRAEGKISFSRMTFSHEMIRLLLTEQLYRGFSILKGEGYHHD
jgi:23S rRNA (pseudouridine1915-N3)-methyltransferase